MAPSRYQVRYLPAVQEVVYHPGTTYVGNYPDEWYETVTIQGATFELSRGTKRLVAVPVGALSWLIVLAILGFACFTVYRSQNISDSERERAARRYFADDSEFRRNFSRKFVEPVWRSGDVVVVRRQGESSFYEHVFSVQFPTPVESDDLVQVVFGPSARGEGIELYFEGNLSDSLRIQIAHPVDARFAERDGELRVVSQLLPMDTVEDNLRLRLGVTEGGKAKAFAIVCICQSIDVREITVWRPTAWFKLLRWMGANSDTHAVHEPPSGSLQDLGGGSRPTLRC